MRPDQLCIATAVYAPECGCRIQIEVRRGDTTPVCPRCSARIAWQFVQSAYLASFRCDQRTSSAGSESLTSASSKSPVWVAPETPAPVCLAL